MIDHELRMCAYVQLACLSHEKQQALPRDRFFLLAGAEACRAGWLDVATRCRELLLQSNPHHQAARFETFPDALRHTEFQELIHQLERKYPIERAEHLLKGLGLEPRGDQLEIPRGERMLSLLSQIHMESTKS